MVDADGVPLNQPAEALQSQPQNKPIMINERFDLISNSVQMESAMKPVRMASGYSDDATPMSQ